MPVYVNASATGFAFDQNHDWLHDALKHKVLSEEPFRKFHWPFKLISG